MISVVLAAYNGEKWIEEQLDSIAAQTRLPDELLVRSDGSSDQTVLRVKEWMERNPQVNGRLLEDDDHLGFKGNFYRLLSQAKGDWIFLCDQDDRWHPEKIESMMEQVESHPDLLLCGSSFQFMHGDGTVYHLPQNPEWSNNGLIPWKMPEGECTAIAAEKMLEHNYFQGCAMVVSRKVVHLYLQSPTEEIPHDWYLALIAAYHGGLYYLDKPLFDYRIHDSNAIGLPQASRDSLKKKYDSFFDDRLRRAVMFDSLQVLKVLETHLPAYWKEEYQERKRFCEVYLQAVDRGDFQAMASLNRSPAMQIPVFKNQWRSGLVYTLFKKGKKPKNLNS